MPQDTKSNPSNGLVERLRSIAAGAEWVGDAEIEAATAEAADALSSQRGENRSANARLTPDAKSADTVVEWVLVPRDDATRDFSDTLLPDEMVDAGIAVIDRAQEDGRSHDRASKIDWDDGMLCVAIYRAMLAAAPTRAPWQPIETAPRDGASLLLAFDSGAVEKARWGLSHGEAAFLIARTEGGSRYPDDKPTHWQPLPASPATPIGGLSLGVEGDEGVSHANSGGTAQAPKSDSAGGH